MNIGLIDVDGHNYPNIALMKISAYHKKLGDNVFWYTPLSSHCDIVYMSKVFSFTEDYKYKIKSDKIIKGGSGYCISIGEDGKEIFDKSKNIELPYEIEHIYPDYSLYPEMTRDTAYGFLSRGCPRGCDFCIVKDKEGRCATKVADLSEFWSGQNNIVLCDPNLIACKEWKNLLQQLIDSNAWVDINQGIDIRMMTEEKAEMIKQLKIKQVHFAFDRYEDKDWIVPKFKMFQEITGWTKSKMSVYVLTNFNTTIEQDLDRIYTLMELNYFPYVMIYEKYKLPKGDIHFRLQKWVNSKVGIAKCPKFEDFNYNYFINKKEKSKRKKLF